MFDLQFSGLIHDQDLQIVQADVFLQIENEVLIDESLCIDAGLPALLNSCINDFTPNRWSEEHEWQTIPFFVCGCGEADCKAFSFLVRHISANKIELTEIEERENQTYRVYDHWVLDKELFRTKIIQVTEQFLEFIGPLEYRPLFRERVSIIKDLLKKVKI